MFTLEDYKAFPLYAKVYFYPLWLLSKLVTGEKLGWHWIVVILAPQLVLCSPILLLPFLKSSGETEKYDDD